MAENPPTVNSDVFENSYIEYATLYVPENSVNQYKSQAPWSGFGQIRGKKGDVNGDGDVDIADAVRIVNFVVGNIPVLAPRLGWNQYEPE